MIIAKKGSTESTIEVEEFFRAPKEKVFKAWTTPESLKKWFMVDEGVTVKNAKIELHVGGNYLIEVVFPGFDPTPIDGAFLKVVIPDLLEYTWSTPVLKDRITKVEVAFFEQETGSKIHLMHGEFENEEQMNLHIEGWKGCLGQLHEFLKAI